MKTFQNQLSSHEARCNGDDKMAQFELLGFSNEILLQIFRSFNDVDLLCAAQVCKRFKGIAKEIVTKKYNDDLEEKYYKVYVYTEDGSDVHQLYREFLETFGQQIYALKLCIEPQTNKHRLLKLINQHCRFTKHVVVRCYNASFPVTRLIHTMPQLTSLTLDYLSCADFAWIDRHYPQLESLCLQLVKNIDVQVLKRFLYINPQLKHLRVIDCRRFPLKVIEPLRNHLNGLKSFEYDTIYNGFTGNCSVVKVENLESLKISTDETSTAKVLTAFGKGNKTIQKLEVKARGEEIDDDQTQDAFQHSIGLFNKLTSLKLDRFTVRNSLIRIFICSLPNLVTLHLNGVQLSEITANFILYMFKKCQSLKEVTLESKFYRLNEDVQFNLDFHRQFAKIVRNRGATKLEIIEMDKTILITEEKIVRNGELQYWTGFGAAASQSKIHLFDLGDKVLEKIYDYLTESDHLAALYETCNKMRNALQQRIKSQWFTVFDEKSAKDTFGRFGKNVCYLAIDINTNDRTRMANTWRYISANYSKQLIEMQLNNVRVDATGSEVVDIPNLLKLGVRSIVTSNSHIFPLMNCPKLTNLEFFRGEILRLPAKSPLPPFGISMNNLTALRIHHFNNEIDKILNHLNDEQCSQGTFR